MASFSVHIVHETYEGLAHEKDLSPRNAKVNTMLTQFVNSLSQMQCSGAGEWLAQLEELTDARKNLPQICGKAECEMEQYWAQYFLKKDVLTTESLREFWYYRNYEALWAIERNLIADPSCKQYVFLGSGPLPLTAVVAVLEDPSLHIVCVDADETACRLSESLIERLNLQGNIRVVQSTAQDYPYQADEFVICASLITQKQKLYDIMHNAGIQQFAVRDAEGAYCFLYEPSPLPEKTQFRELRCTIPTKECINTTRLFERV